MPKDLNIVRCEIEVVKKIMNENLNGEGGDFATIDVGEVVIAWLGGLQGDYS